MEEVTSRKYMKELYFEKSGETFAVEIQLKNVSPGTELGTIIPFLNTLFDRLKKELELNNTGLK